MRHIALTSLLSTSEYLVNRVQWLLKKRVSETRAQSTFVRMTGTQQQSFLQTYVGRQVQKPLCGNDFMKHLVVQRLELYFKICFNRTRSAFVNECLCPN